MMWRGAAHCVVACLAVLAAGAAADPAPAPDAPAGAAPDGRRQQQISDAITRLSSADPAEREEASGVLWAAGEAAAPALAEAAAGEDAEVARRAAEILRSLRYGILPDTPKAVLDLLNLYRQAEPSVVQSAVTGLAARGADGARILGRLWQEEREPWRRTLLTQKLAECARAAAPVLLAGRSFDAVLPMLEAAAESPGQPGAPSVRDLSAFLLLRGRGALDERVARLKPLVAGGNAGDAGAPGGTGAGAGAATLLTYLCRARGDLPAARWAAEQSGDETLLDALLVESGDWKAMAARADARALPGASVEELGFAAAYHRMAGDAAAARELGARIEAYADRRPEESWLVAEALFLNDLPDEGLRVLLKHRQEGAASELLAPRMQFKELLDLSARATEEKSPEAARIEARAAATRHFLGDTKGAREAIERLLGENDKDRDFETYAALAEAAAAVHLPELAEEGVVRALGSPRPTDDLADLFEKAELQPGERAARWWALMRRKYKEPARVSFGRLRSLLRGTLPPAQAESLARAAGEEAMRLPIGDRDAWLLDIGQTLVSAGLRDAAKNFFRRLNAAPAPPSPVPVAFVRLGDFEAEDGRWDEAATLYGRAWEMDRSRPLPPLLRGHALAKIGRPDEGRELVELAHLMPLADEAARHELMVELEQRKLTDEARRERDLIVRTAPFSSWFLSDALRRAGDEAYGKGEYLAAAGLWDRAFLDNQGRLTRFAEPWQNLAMPSLVHRARALGLMRAGDFAAAAAEADLAMRYAPGDADAVIAFVNELDRLGRKADADALYRQRTAPYRALCDAYPASAQSHNQFAWAACKCGRDLDDALAHATRAVELEPDNTASLDTLAETHFRRGEYQKAIEAINRCIELEPKDARHAQQLERFSAALAGRK